MRPAGHYPRYTAVSQLLVFTVGPCNGDAECFLCGRKTKSSIEGVKVDAVLECVSRLAT
jgi:hypothetical protein